ncbi:MAG: hypothetical protein Q8N08_08965 [Methanobacteriaceae archaeon]|nr:hypothetical protein [Methanobacteriaceae archaeon]
MHEDFLGSTIPDCELVGGFMEVEVHPDILSDLNLNDGDKHVLNHRLEILLSN